MDVFQASIQVRCHAVATFTLIIMSDSPAIQRLFQGIQGNTLSEVYLLNAIVLKTFFHCLYFHSGIDFRVA